MDLIDELRNIISELESASVDYALCGGLAMAVYAFPRSTLDIDIMIHRQDLDKVVSLARDLGFLLDAGLMTFQMGKVQIYRVTKIRQDIGESLVLDLLLVSEDIRDAWDSRIKMEWEYGTISVVSPQGLITLKSMRKSGQDKDDITFLKSIIDEG